MSAGGPGQTGGPANAVDRAAREAPPWAAPLEDALRQALRRAPLLAHATPTNLDAEVLRLEAAHLRGEPLVPRFVHRPAAEGLADLAAALLELVRRLPSGDALGEVYARRALQVCGDLHWARDLAAGAAAATGAVRYPRRDRFDDEADILAERWVAEGVAAAAVPDLPAANVGPYRAAEVGASPEERFERYHAGDVLTDDEGDPRSLVRRLREDIGARRLPVRVVVVRGIAPLAAAGDGVVQVVAGRRVSVADVERTVAHEVLGHLVPSCAAAGKAVGIFSIGTEHGSDDQEGRAVGIERRHGHLSWLRKRTLALRHVAARAAHHGAPFEEVVAALESRGAMPRESIRLAARAMRGGGLGREVIYLPALLRVEAALAEAPELDHVLAAGRVGVDDAAVLADWV